MQMLEKLQNQRSHYDIITSDGDNQKLKTHINKQINENRIGAQNSISLLAKQQNISPNPRSKNASMMSSRHENFPKTSRRNSTVSVSLPEIKKTQTCHTGVV